MSINPKIKEIARYVRQEVAKWVKDNPWIDDSDLCGACAIASYALWRVLKSLGYDASFVSAVDHCWVELNNKVIDITATQFKIKAHVHISSPDRYKSRYRIVAKDIAAIEETSNWVYQNPAFYTKEVDKLIEQFQEAA